MTDPLSAVLGAAWGWVRDHPHLVLHLVHAAERPVEEFMRDHWHGLRAPERPPPHIERAAQEPAATPPSPPVWRELSPPEKPSSHFAGAMIDVARAELGIDCHHKYNFAVCGSSSGAGKSSLVNALRGLHTGDIGAAPVGQVEKTVDTIAYPHPVFEHVVFWDIPDAGTAGKPDDNRSFRGKCLYAFDCLIVVFAGGTDAIDTEIATRARRWGVPVLFVRNNFDADAKDYLNELDPPARPETVEDLKRELVGLRERLINDARSRIREADPGLDDSPIYVLSSSAYVDEHMKLYADEASLVDELKRLAAQRAC